MADLATTLMWPLFAVIIIGLLWFIITCSILGQRAERQLRWTKQDAAAARAAAEEEIT